MNSPAGNVAVLVPCHNEERSVARVVHDFRAVLPTADIYVYDNRSSDQTAERAREAGAIVRSVSRRGKGSVVRRMFADVDADVYVLVDGDATYDAGAAQGMVKLLVDDELDMVVGKREAIEGQDVLAVLRPGIHKERERQDRPDHSRLPRHCECVRNGAIRGNG